MSEKASKSETTTVESKTPWRSNRDTVAGNMMDAIMENKLSDDEIFSTVAAKFGLDEGKRSYVSWYRNYLRKRGFNPPNAVTKTT